MVDPILDALIHHQAAGSSAGGRDFGPGREPAAGAPWRLGEADGPAARGELQKGTP